MTRAIGRTALFALAAVALAAPTVEAAQRVKMGASFSGLHHPAYATVATFMKEEVQKFPNVELVVTDSKDQLAKQINDLEDLITKGVKVLMVNAVQKGVEPILEKAAAKGIIVLAIQREIQSPAVRQFVGTDNVDIGKLGATWVAEQMKGKGNLVVIEGIPGAASSDDRRTGADKIWAKHAGIKILAKQTGMYNRVKALEVMENILQVQKEIDWVFCYNDSMAMGVVGALRGANRKGVKVLGMDAIPDAVQAIEKGEMTATVAIPFDEEGRVAIRNAAKLAGGEKLPPKHIIPAYICTKDQIQNGACVPPKGA